MGNRYQCAINAPHLYRYSKVAWSFRHLLQIYLIAFDLPLKNFDQIRKKLCTKNQSHEYHSDCMKSISEPITVWIVLKSQIRAMCSMHLEGLSTEESAFSFFLRINQAFFTDFAVS